MGHAERAGDWHIYRFSFFSFSSTKESFLSRKAFITSVQTTTGYGDIIPVTGWGKFFTVLYAFVGIPVFMWYIVKLGALFRLIVMKLFFWLLVCLL